MLPGLKEGVSILDLIASHKQKQHEAEARRKAALEDSPSDDSDAGDTKAAGAGAAAGSARPTGGAAARKTSGAAKPKQLVRVQRVRLRERRMTFEGTTDEQRRSELADVDDAANERPTDPARCRVSGAGLDASTTRRSAQFVIEAVLSDGSPSQAVGEPFVGARAHAANLQPASAPLQLRTPRPAALHDPC